MKYAVENYRVEQKTDYEKLVLEITTDGSIHPKEALKEAAKILIYHFMLFSDEKITLETSDADGNEEFDEVTCRWYFQNNIPCTSITAINSTNPSFII